MSERFSRETLALALAREAVASIRRNSLVGDPLSPVDRLVEAFDALDNTGVFSSVDRQTDYTAAVDILSANAADRQFASPTGLAFSQVRHPAGQVPPSPLAQDLDPAEWGDTTRADMARHQQEYTERYGAGPENIKPLTPLTQEQAEALFSDTHPRAARELGDLIQGTDDEADGRF